MRWNPFTIETVIALEAKSHKIINGPPVKNYWALAGVVYVALAIFINVFPEAGPDWLHGFYW